VVFFVLPAPLPPPPSPLRPNASRRWSFSSFRRASHLHHLPRVQMRAGGGHFHRFDPTPTTTTSLASKCEPEVVFFVVSTRSPPPPPPSRLNASWRWFFLSFQHLCHHHHLHRVQTRAGGGHFRRFDVPPTTTTSLASKCELEVVLFGSFKASAAAATSSPPTNRQRRKWTRGGEADERNVGRVSKMIGRDTEEGQGATTCLSLFPRALVNGPPLICEVFFFYGCDEGAAFIPHAAPFNFFFLFVVNNMYLGHNTIKIVSAAPQSTTGFFQRLQRCPGKF